eukprot:5388207-Pleurochrysis_carterae.AAC.4
MGSSTRHMRGRPSEPSVAYPGGPARRSEGRENSQGRGSECGAEGLIVINAVNLCASLHAEASFEGAAAFALIHPYEAHKRAAGRDIGTVNVRPAAIGDVVCDFSTFSSTPTDMVVGHGLLSGTRVGGGVRYGKRAARCLAPGWLERRASQEKRSRLTVAQRVLAQPASKWRARRGRRVSSRSILRRLGSGRSGPLATGWGVVGGLGGVVLADGAVETRTRANRKLRSGGYAAVRAEDHWLLLSFCPPAIEAWE